ncbi:hypothetical protein D918_05777 [Trichuris suis]|nr:hypothetical protein D918_05777 [Trichuris suis]
MEPAGNVSEGLKTKAEAVKIISSLSCSIVLQLRKLAKGVLILALLKNKQTQTIIVDASFISAFSD